MTGTLQKVQVRTTYNLQESGAYKVNLRVTGGNRSGTGKVKSFIDTDVDYLFVIVEDRAKYFILKDAITNKRAINVCNDGQYAKYRVE